MNATDIINVAVPVFILIMGLEALLSWRLGWGFYRLNDALLNMSLGATRQVVDVFTKVFLFAAYVAIYQWGHCLDIEINAWWHWPLVLLAVDFIYYWQHRWSHEINLLWAGHLVHHSSEEFNISVALRQSFVHDLMVYPLYFLLALIGLPPFAFFIGVAFLAIYQYWIHTRAVPRFPEWIEGIFNTPSAHRVHHGSNTQYIDKNYAGLFIFIDRLFGTYAAEKEPVRYGLTTPVKTWNPLWANVHYFVELWQNAKTMPQWKHRLALWFKPPGWAPGVPASAPETPTGPKFETRISKHVWRYALFQYALAGAAIFPIIAFYKALPAGAIILLASFAAWAGCNVGSLQQGRQWAWHSEHGKWGVALLAAIGYAAFNPGAFYVVAGFIVLGGASLIWLQTLKGQIELLPQAAAQR